MKLKTIISYLHLKKQEALTLADLYPVNLLAYTISRNIPKCMNEAHLQATARFIQSHLVARYPAPAVKKYVTDLKWQLFFRRIELGLQVPAANNL